MNRLSKFVPVALAVLLFASCEPKKSEPEASTAPNVPTESPAIASEVPEAVVPEVMAPEVESTSEVVATASERISELTAKYEAEQKAFMTAYRKASNADERNKIREELSPDAAQVAGELLAIVDESPDDPASFEALDWVVTNVREGETYDSAIAQLFDKFIERPEMKDLCASIAGGIPNPQIEQRLRVLIEKSPHDDVKGTATYTLANYLSRLPEMVELADDPRAANALGEDGVAYLKNFVQNDQEVETLFTAVINEYPDVVGPRDTLLSERAEKALFALRYLSIGKVAPDIEGEDVDGESFKLSDYRGKVVMLDFWGDW